MRVKAEVIRGFEDTISNMQELKLDNGGSFRMEERFKRILVTGGAGFIGSHFVEAALQKGLRVKVLDNLSSGRLDNLSSCLVDERLEFVEGDIRCASVVDTAAKGIDAVVNLAALVSVPNSIKEPKRTALTNSLGTLSLLEACVKNRIERFVYASSCAVYGNPRYLPIDEEHPTNPLSPYAASKLAGEAYCNAFTATYGLETVCLRLFNVYGLRQGGGPYAGVIVKFLERLKQGKAPVIFGDGSQTRDFVHVSDVVEALLLSLDCEGVGERINVGSGRAVTINELAQLMMRITGKDMVPIYEARRDGEITYSEVNIAKAQSLLGYRPRVSLEEGLARIISERFRDPSTIHA